ncbi:MAG: hypothetical protein J1F35_05875 [Erysipelotrichales bacterium]|nr:hypothetical protein [Erysipelotrichales bacterium]
MKVKEIIEKLSEFDENQEVRVFAQCKNKSLGINYVLQYNTDVMIYLDKEDEKNLFNINP